MNVQYKWNMQLNGHTYEVHPIYKDDLSLDYEKETGQQFFRAKLSSKISLVGTDANRIITAPFYTEFIITIQKSVDMGLTWANYYRCHFYKTDCTINLDDMQVQVQPQVLDSYEAVLNGYEKEYNLIELAPAIERINAAKRPMLQIYADGDSVVSCLYQGNYFETDKVGDGDPTDYGFKAFGQRTEMDFTNSTDVGFTTPFPIQLQDLNDGDKFYNADGVYYLEYFYDRIFAKRGFNIKRITDNLALWKYEQSMPNPWPSTFEFEPIDESQSTLTANTHSFNVYGRYVLDKSSVDGQDCAHIEPNDIASNNRNYHYVIGYHLLGLQYSKRYSTEPTEWGRNDAGLYFLPPDDEEEWYPAGQSLWVNASLWIRYDENARTFEQEATKVFTYRDNFPIESVISVLLKKIAPNVTHQGTAEYSHFLYDDAKVGAPADWLRGSRTFITQKSNVLAGEYQEPAKKAQVTLKDIMDMLKRVFGCYWFIDAQNRLRIEHIQWFKNGGSYTTTPTIGYDLTTLENLPNGKVWAFGTSKYEYDKEDMPARYQYEWMDKSTDLFNGNPINVLSKFVKEDKVEEVTVANFTSDIDYMLLAGENCSKDGFALFQAKRVNGVWTLPFETFYKEQYQYSLQNYMVAMVYLQSKFLTYDMPSWAIEIDGTAVTAAGIQRSKKQTLTFPVGPEDPDMQKLVKTAIGSGQYDKLSIRLTSRSAKVTLKYNTYDD